MKDPVAGRNINITPPGGEYRWHYDRNAVTAILYLNEVPGGETEIFPNFRLVLRGKRYWRSQQRLDDLLRLRPVRHLFGHRTLVMPHRGTLVIMRGDIALHCVREVLGTENRIAVILAYDLSGLGGQQRALNDYIESFGLSKPSTMTEVLSRRSNLCAPISCPAGRFPSTS